MSELPFRNIRVADFGWVQTGPQVTQWLAVMGADVIKIESSKYPDLARNYSLPGEDQTADFLRLVKTSPVVLATREANKDLNELAEERPAVAEAIAAIQRVLNAMPTTKSDDVVALEWLIKHTRIVIKAEAQRTGVAKDNGTAH